MKRYFSLLISFAICMIASATVEIKSLGGWFESGYITWTAYSNATDYNVYISSDGNTWTQLDKNLIRKYKDYYRADAVGLKAGSYKFKVVPVVSGSETDATISSSFTATAYDRSGFAHVGMSGGIGAYKNDGTLKAGAKVLYVYAGNAKTVSTSVITSSKGTITTGKGLKYIISLYQKGYDTTPLDIRIIGTITASDMDRFDSSDEGLQVKGHGSYSEMPITIEGIGEDAAISGFGILLHGCKGTELRNFAVVLCMDDAISIDSDNSNVWVHNMDFFYGQTGSDADQVKGDGTVDIKADSKNITVSYNHFFDNGKCSLGGMKSEATTSWITYHHNWFDHSDSRHPRIRTMFFHIYNNYFDGNSKYGVGMTMGGSALVEANYFRNCNHPFLISGQGTDAERSGTFSGEDGGVIKAFNNTITGGKTVKYYDGSQTDGKWDAVLVKSRDEAVTATAYSGGTSYNSEADIAARTTYTENKIDAPDDVPTVVTGQLGAGRMNHGDFSWTFDSSEDTNYDIITSLKTELTSYKSQVIGFANGTLISEDNGSESGETGGETGDTGEDTPSTPITSENICYFTASTKSTSSNMVTVSGNYSNGKGTVTYNNKEYTDCVKMESSTSITITPTSNCTITLIFGGTTTAASKNINLDGVKTALNSDGQYSFDGTADKTYTIKKSDSINLFLIVFTPKSYSKGDVDGDGKISITDISALINILKGEATDTHNTADMDGDSDVDLDDLKSLVSKLINQE